MNFKQSFILAIKSLLTSKMRSFLTMLGIIIGIAAVIILVSMVNGMTNEMVESFESMGTNLLTVNITGRGSSRSISADDMLALADENPDIIMACSPSVSSSGTIKNGNTNITASLTGVSENFAEIRKLDIAEGRFLEYIDVERKQKVCVIGTYIVKELFNGISPVGEELKINNSVYRIVGVLEEKGDSSQTSQDNCIYIPYTTASRSFARTNTYYFSAIDEEHIDDAINLIDKKLFKVFSNENLYSISSQDQMIDMVGNLTGQMSMILVGIAAISLLVGGIGIMNIMLVSVTERTREIGIRKSLGAKRKDIMSQFVVEAATTSTIGGILGIILGIFSSFGVAKLMDMKSVISGESILIAFSVSAAIGIAFGYFPANKAAKLNPIEALRHD